jgi:hypothetical protein
VFSLAWQPRRAARAAAMPAPVPLAAGLLVLLEAIVYLRLPHDEGYLLPVVPFLMLALATRVTPARFRVLCAAFLLSPFLFGVDVDPPKKGSTPIDSSPLAWRLPAGGESVVVEPFRGPLLRDHAKRERMLQLAAQLEAWWPHQPEQFRLAAGNLVPMLYHLFAEDPNLKRVARTFTPAEREQARAEGIPLYALPDAERRMARSEGVPAIPGVIVIGTGSSP